MTTHTEAIPILARAALLCMLASLAGGCATATLHESVTRTGPYQRLHLDEVHSANGVYLGTREISGEEYYEYVFPDPVWEDHAFWFTDKIHVPSRTHLHISIPTDTSVSRVRITRVPPGDRDGQPATIVFIPDWKRVDHAPLHTILSFDDEPIGCSSDYKQAIAFSTPYPEIVHSN
jgi:hypothetical protein